MRPFVPLRGDGFQVGRAIPSPGTLHVLVKSNSELLLVDCDPPDAPIVRHGPFVMNTFAEVERASPTNTRAEWADLTLTHRAHLQIRTIVNPIISKRKGLFHVHAYVSTCTQPITPRAHL